VSVLLLSPITAGLRLGMCGGLSPIHCHPQAPPSFTLSGVQTSNVSLQGFPCERMYVTFFAWTFISPSILTTLISISQVTVTGLVFGAEAALLEHENLRRREENLIRRSARLDLARQGLIGTESEIAKWREAREQALASKPPETNEPSRTPS
jgi:hypothetical protein